MMKFQRNKEKQCGATMQQPGSKSGERKIEQTWTKMSDLGLLFSPPSSPAPQPPRPNRCAKHDVCFQKPTMFHPLDSRLTSWSRKSCNFCAMAGDSTCLAAKSAATSLMFCPSREMSAVDKGWRRVLCYTPFLPKSWKWKMGCLQY